MRNSNERHRLAQELEILCFEMEAAGLVDTFPCLAIRGISDYADSHVMIDGRDGLQQLPPVMLKIFCWLNLRKCDGKYYSTFLAGDTL